MRRDEVEDWWDEEGRGRDDGSRGVMSGWVSEWVEWEWVIWMSEWVNDEWSEWVSWVVSGVSGRGLKVDERGEWMEWVSKSGERGVSIEWVEWVSEWVDEWCHEW